MGEPACPAASGKHADTRGRQHPVASRPLDQTMSSAPHDSTTQDRLFSSDDDLNADHEAPPSLAVMKSVIGYRRNQSAKSVRAVAKYVAAKHPDFDLFPALPSGFAVEFESQTLREGPDGDYIQETTFSVSFGNQHLLQDLGQVTIKRTYDCLSDARDQSGDYPTAETTVHFTEAKTA